ncbi:uncharacterized protein A4U43_C04F28280 [Asparagus officinalis]|uniref:Uncharacterized protein n=1 Tax=Asparagus officinalis TaxID=4686 RepID=A0A5P1F706_ASPOF|nr:uncharacterized protein A4U43_C04F28280 [Asparagus officinalis]
MGRRSAGLRRSAIASVIASPLLSRNGAPTTTPTTIARRLCGARPSSNMKEMTPPEHVKSFDLFSAAAHHTPAASPPPLSSSARRTQQPEPPGRKLVRHSHRSHSSQAPARRPMALRPMLVVASRNGRLVPHLNPQHPQTSDPRSDPRQSPPAHLLLHASTKPEIRSVGQAQLKALCRPAFLPTTSASSRPYATLPTRLPAGAHPPPWRGHARCASSLARRLSARSAWAI